jgi:hypothetical protein
MVEKRVIVNPAVDVSLKTKIKRQMIHCQMGIESNEVAEDTFDQNIGKISGLCFCPEIKTFPFNRSKINNGIPKQQSLI